MPCDEPLRDCLVKGGLEASERAPYGLRVEAFRLPQIADQSAEMLDGEIFEPDLPEDRDVVILDVVLVMLQRGRSEIPVATGRQEGVTQICGQLVRPALG